MTTEPDLICGDVEKLSFRADAGVGDVTGVGVVELLCIPRPVAANRCSVGAELPICTTSDVDDGFFTNVTVPAAMLLLVDGFTPATIRAAL